MTDDEKKEKIVRALVYAMEEKKQGTLQELITWIKGITPQKIKTLILNKAQSIADQKRGSGEGQITEADEENALINELQTDL